MKSQADFDNEILEITKKIKEGSEIQPFNGGACYIQRGTFRTCFDNVSADQCSLIARQANASVTAYVSGQACQL